MTGAQIKIALALAIAAGAAYVIYRSAHAVSTTVAAAVDAVNPFNNDNVINQAATSIYQSVTGSKGTIGTDIYDGVQGIGHRIDETNKAMREEEFGWPI